MYIRVTAGVDDLFHCFLKYFYDQIIFYTIFVKVDE